MRLEHIGIAVHDIEAALGTFEALLDTKRYKFERIESEGVVTHFLSVNGVKIELLESTDSDSPVSKFLKKRGDGIHHLAFSVDDLDLSRTRMQELGFRIVGATEKTGADGKRIFFLHPKDVFGVLIECCTNDSLAPDDVVNIHPHIEVRTFGSRQNPVVIIIVSEPTDLVSSEDLARRLEPTSFVVLLEGLQDVNLTAEMVHSLYEMLPGSSPRWLTVGSVAQQVSPAVFADAGSVDSWIHIDRRAEKARICFKETSDDLKRLLIHIGETPRGLTWPSVSLPEYAICPEKPETDVLIPLIRSFWNTES